MVASNLAILLAKRGNRVTLVDLDTGGANLHILFGLFRPTATLTDFLEKRQKKLQSILQPIPGYDRLSLLVGTGETLITANLPYGKKKRLISHLRQLEGDIILVDVGAGTNYHALDFFLFADRYVTVATPDPTSVLDVYRFIKLAAIRKVLSAFLSRNPVKEVLIDREFHNVEEVLTAVGETNEEGKTIAEQALHHFNPSLILNRVSNRSQINTSHLQHMVKQYIGTDLMVLGRIPDDQAAEQSIRKYLPVVDWAPHSPSAEALEHITENLVNWLKSTGKPKEMTETSLLLENDL